MKDEDLGVTHLAHLVIAAIEGHAMNHRNMTEITGDPVATPQADVIAAACLLEGLRPDADHRPGEAALCLADMVPALEAILRNMILVPLVVARAAALLVILRAVFLLVVVGPLGIRVLSLVNLTRERQRHVALVHQRRVLVACVNDLEDLVEMLRIMMQERHSQHALHRAV
jgi:hypothetical protein